MRPVRPVGPPVPLQYPPDYEEEQQDMLHDGPSHITIRDYAPYRCE
jgi:hypothetical protein